MIKTIIIILFSLVSFSYAFAQEEEKLTPLEYFESADYVNALKGYLTTFRKEPGNYETNRKIGECYLILSGDRSKAIEYLEFAVKNDNKNAIDDVILDLAHAYSYGYRFDDAIATYKKFREKTVVKNYEYIDREIEKCEFAKELIKNPIDVEFINLGKEVNSPGPDYYPFVSEDESMMVFTSRRKGSTGGIPGLYGYNTCDIYITNVLLGKWQKAKKLATQINTPEDEECVGLTNDGKILFMYVENLKGIGDLLMCLNNGKGFKSEPTPLPSIINTKYLEGEAYMNHDASILLFSSSRPGGIGGQDIYMCKKADNGKWLEAVNVGAKINTKYDESFPRITEDGLTMYFCSKGHKSMGGFDIFKSTYDEEKKEWSTPENVGYPINTPDDDMNFSLCANERDAYKSCWRKDSYGDLDIYKIIFKNKDEQLTIIKGKVLSADSLMAIQPTMIISNKTSKEIYPVKINPQNGKYVVSLPLGIYEVSIINEGFEPISKEVKILGLSDYKPLIELNYSLMSLHLVKMKAEGKVKPKSAGSSKSNQSTSSKKK